METLSLQPNGKRVGKYRGRVTRKEEGPVLLDGVQDNSNKTVSLLLYKLICCFDYSEISGLVHTVFN